MLDTNKNYYINLNNTKRVFKPAIFAVVSVVSAFVLSQKFISDSLISSSATIKNFAADLPILKRAQNPSRTVHNKQITVTLIFVAVFLFLDQKGKTTVT